MDYITFWRQDCQWVCERKFVSIREHQGRGRNATEWNKPVCSPWETQPSTFMCCVSLNTSSFPNVPPEMKVCVARISMK